eukprot:UN28111
MGLRGSATEGLMKNISHQMELTHDRKFIEVQVRNNGVLVQEKIPAYINLALRLMYNNIAGASLTEANAAILTTLSVAKGKSYDHPDSTSEIEPFIKLHNLDTSILEKDDLSEFKTFNDFFARALKPEARPIAKKDDDAVVVSPADCRMIVFESVPKATKFWIKGDGFT